MSMLRAGTLAMLYRQRHIKARMRRRCGCCLEEGVDPNAEDGRYSNTLHAAVDGGHDGVVLLLESTAQPPDRLIVSVHHIY
jgi:hypothetical protein